jgi:hypothetical protein
MAKENIVYILGAGSSKDFGLPLGYEIFHTAYEIFKVVDKNNTDLTPIFERVFHKAETDLNKIYFNLPEDRLKYPLFEEVLSIVYDQIEEQERIEYQKYIAKDTDKPYEKEPLFHNGIRKVFDNFVNLMGLTILYGMISPYPDRKIDAYERFIKSLNFAQQEISFISLNYDIIIDDILLRCEKERIIDGYGYGIYVGDIKNEKERRKGKIKLLKPHGSLNLFFCPHKHRRSVEPGFYFSEDASLFVEIINKNRHFKCPKCGSIPTPLIIPPLYNKSLFVKDSERRSQPSGGFFTRSHLASYRLTVEPLAKVSEKYRQKIFSAGT